MDTKKLKPILAPLLHYRQFDIVFASVPLLLLILDLLNIFHWRCPFKAVFSLDCPGCGMTRAALMVLKGDFRAAFCLHPFIYLFILLWVWMVICALLPEANRKLFTAKVSQIEEKTGIFYILFTFFVIYGFARLILQI